MSIAKIEDKKIVKSCGKRPHFEVIFDLNESWVLTVTINLFTLPLNEGNKTEMARLKEINLIHRITGDN